MKIIHELMKGGKSHRLIIDGVAQHSTLCDFPAFSDDNTIMAFSCCFGVMEQYFMLVPLSITVESIDNALGELALV